MRESISIFLATLVDYAWGTPLIILLVGGGLGLFIYPLLTSRVFALKGFIHAFKLVFGKFHHKNDDQSKGQITHFQALCNALAATVGLGNISGVAVAIYQGGAGAVFWMWVVGFIGMNTKFFECTLAIMFRGKDYEGEVQGGPMYVIETALPKYFKPLALFFSLCGLIGAQALFQVNQVAIFIKDQYGFDPQVIGIITTIVTAYILFGGLKRLVQWTEKLVPAMALLYVGCTLIIVFLNIDKVPDIFALIFTEAFTGKAAGGGAAGLTVWAVLKTGVKRAAFSNEAGIGTAPMAHGNAKTSEPVSEGLVAMLGPFFDTLIICTLTALVILIATSSQDMGEASGIVLTAKAFTQELPGWGVHALGLSIFLFGFSTILGMANYNQKCWNYLFKGHKYFRQVTFISVYCLALYFGSISPMDDVLNLLDSGYAFMTFPNMIATLILAPKVVHATKKYFKKYNV